MPRQAAMVSGASLTRIQNARMASFAYHMTVITARGGCADDIISPIVRSGAMYYTRASYRAREGEFIPEPALDCFAGD